jgi:hypothetical protein
MAVTLTHVFLWGRSATNHIEKALMDSPCSSHGYFPDFSALKIASKMR